MNKQAKKSVQWTPQQLAERQAIRHAFRDWRPSPEELISSGVAAQLNLEVLHSPAEEVLALLRETRESECLSLAEVSTRSGIDEPTLSRLEEGAMLNPTVDTLWRYAAAVGKRLILSAENIRATRPKPPRKTASRGKRTA